MKLRLLLWTYCKRRCPGCCNKDWNLYALPVCKDYSVYDTIMLTGGEPMMFPDSVCVAVSQIRQQTRAPIFMYTADVSRRFVAYDILDRIDGMTITLHEQSDVEPYYKFAENAVIDGKSMRLNIFSGVTVQALPGWIVKDNIEWINHSPLPDDEVFMRW